MRILIVLATVLLCSVFATGQRIIEDDNYSVVKLEDLAAGKVFASHVITQGWVRYVKKQTDGDLHIRLCSNPTLKRMDRVLCIVAEIRPNTKLKHPRGVMYPRKGQYVVVSGLTRFDRWPNHNWWEVHPVDSWEETKPPQAAPQPSLYEYLDEEEEDPIVAKGGR